MANVTNEQRRALRFLARRPDGCAQVVLLGYGLKLSVLSALIDDGLATATSRDTRQRRRWVPVAWITITEAGRKAIAGLS
jgi:hypothetical protein